MVRTFVRSFLLLSLLMSPIYAGTHAYFNDDVRDAVIALHESKPGSWSAEFNKVCEMMKRGEVSASSEELKRVVDECMKELSRHNSPEARALMATMEAYRDALKSGAAVVNEEDAQDGQASRRKKCKTFNRLVVRCLLNVLGNATIAGDLSVGGATTLGSLTVGGATIFGGPITVGGVSITGAVLGYGFAATQAITPTVGATSDITFTSFGPSSNVTYGTTGTGSSMIVPAGTYAFVYTVSGLNATPALAIGFELFNNTAGAVVPNSIYSSGAVAAATNQTVTGVVLATFAVPSAISLRNASGAVVTLTIPTGIVGASNTASMAAIRLA